MAQFKAFSPKVEVYGQSVLAVIEGMVAFRSTALRILAEHGIVDPQAEGWYPQQPYLDAYKEIAEKIGPVTLKEIGKRVPERALWPSDIDTIEKALASIDVAYHMNHRGGEIGRYQFEKTGERSGKMNCYNPYPCSFDTGLIEATAKKFALKGARVVIKHDDTQPCRQKGGNFCIYLISW